MPAACTDGHRQRLFLRPSADAGCRWPGQSCHLPAVQRSRMARNEPSYAGTDFVTSAEQPFSHGERSTAGSSPFARPPGLEPRGLPGRIYSGRVQNRQCRRIRGPAGDLRHLRPPQRHPLPAMRLRPGPQSQRKGVSVPAEKMAQTDNSRSTMTLGNE